MRAQILLTVAAIFIADHALAAGCGSKGGPGFRGPSGSCVGWKQLSKVCGDPPTTFCTYEGAGVGDTALEKGRNWIEANTLPKFPKPDGNTANADTLGPTTAPTQPRTARAFNERKAKADGVVCVSPQIVAKLNSCPKDKDAAGCTAQTDEAVAKRECAKVVKGADASIQAGSHSFDWVRVKLKGDARELWAARALILD